MVHCLWSLTDNLDGFVHFVLMEFFEDRIYSVVVFDGDQPLKHKELLLYMGKRNYSLQCSNPCIPTNSERITSDPLPTQDCTKIAEQLCQCDQKTSSWTFSPINDLFSHLLEPDD